MYDMSSNVNLRSLAFRGVNSSCYALPSRLLGEPNSCGARGERVESEIYTLPEHLKCMSSALSKAFALSKHSSYGAWASLSGNLCSTSVSAPGCSPEPFPQGRAKKLDLGLGEVS